MRSCGSLSGVMLGLLLANDQLLIFVYLSAGRATKLLVCITVGAVEVCTIMGIGGAKHYIRIVRRCIR